MPLATYVLEVDWGNDGTFAGDDIITTFTLEVEYGRGRDYASQLTGRSTAGQLAATLLNTDGRFSSFNTSSPLSPNILPGRKVRLRSTAPTIATLWTGFLDSIEPLPRVSGLTLARLRALGPLSRIAERDVKVAMQANILTGTAIGLVLDDAGWPAADRTIDAGQTTMTRWWAEGKALSALRAIEESEAGFLGESADGKIVFEDRHHRLKSPHTISQATYSDAAAAARPYRGIVQADPLKEIFNSIEAEVQLYSVGALAILWTHPESGADSPSIEAGASREFWAGYPNSDSPPEAFAVDVWTTPVATTDFIANSAANGSGTDLTTSIAVAVSKFAQAMKITLTNNHASLTAFITLLQSRGTPVNGLDPARVLNEDSPSQTKFGKRHYPLPGPFVLSSAIADDYTRFLLATYKDPIPVVSLTLQGPRNSDLLTEVLTRDVSERITIVATGGKTDLGINEDFFLEHAQHHIGANRMHEATYQCSPAKAYSGFWVLDTSILDTSTKLAY